MMEWFKSFLLMVLVITSLLQSYMLAYSNPKFEPLNQSDYVKTELLGTKVELEDLLFPEEMVLHLTNQAHSVLYPGDLFYPTILEKVKQRVFEGFRKTNLYAAGVNWDDLRNKQLGLELRFGQGIPISVLQKLLRFNGDLPSENDTITRIWITVKDNKEEVRTFFFTDNVNTVYEVIKADFTVKDLADLVAIADYPAYHTTNGDYYLPNKPISIPAYSFGFTQFTGEQLKQSFFVDPGITRNLKERDGSLIYTDGKRGLQLNNELHWMNFSDPVTPVDNKNDVKENLLSAVQFINQHGGWNGKFVLSRAPEKASPTGQTFVFRQYYDRYPIIGQRFESYGTMRVNVQKGIVSSYERSTLVPDLKSVKSSPMTLAGGEPLDERIKNYPKKNSVVTIFPAYLADVSEKTMDLKPVWAVELRDGSYDFLP